MGKAKLGQKLIYLLFLNGLIFFTVIIIPAVSARETIKDTSLKHEQLALQINSLDPDYDGISTVVEQGGWYNASGGPYVTDPNKADSDGDGLLDGEEQLYDTNPLDWHDPGLYVKYQPDYQTRKYYAWQQHGNKFFTHDSSSRASIYRDVIVRRGTTLFVGGPQGATLNITKNQSNLTTLASTSNSCTSGWEIPIPANATAGAYTLRAQKDGWTSNPFTLYVIFDLKGANQNDIDVLAYNERDPDNSNYKKDETAIYFDTSYEVYNPDFNPNNHSVYGWGIGWQTDYLTQKVFENYVMPAINGYNSQESAANALGSKVDQTLTIDWFKFPNSTANALNWHTSDCTGHASLLTSFLRSAGISSRPVVVNWKNAHYDTATEVWVGSSWKVMRAYVGGEFSGSPDIPPSPPLVSGTLSLRSRSDWGHQEYTQGSSDMIMVAGSDWQWNQININYSGTLLRDYLTARPGQWSQIKRWNWVQTPLQDYWGINPPTVIGDCSSCGSAPVGTNNLSLTSNQVNTGFQTQPELAHLTRVVADHGEDLDGDGRYDHLTLEVEVEVSQPGFYTIGGVLNDNDPTTHIGRMIDGIEGAQTYLELQAGLHTIILTFSGPRIREADIAGPYLINQLWITQLQHPNPAELMDHLVDYQNPGYLTAAYKLTDFDDWGATLTNHYNHKVSDKNGDGYLDSLTISTNLNITQQGAYRVEAELDDGQGNLVATAEWTGSGGQVTLQFDALLSKMTPYYLRSVNLYNTNNQLIDFAEETPGVYTIGSLYNVGLMAMAVTTPTVTSVTTSDSNGDGKYDNLNFKVNLTILVAGEYRLEGWLESSNGTPISWQTSAPVSVGIGGQTMSLSFPGQAINELGLNGPYQLVALKVLKSVYTVIDEVPIAYKTPGYASTDFEGSQNEGVVIQDAGDANNWNMSATTWGLTSQASHSPLYSWTDSPDGDYSSGTTSLTSKSLSINSGAAPQISFQGCYNINPDGDQGKVELNGNGNWATVPGATYTGVSNGWTQQQFALPPLINSDSLALRFAMTGNASQNADGWYVDDVRVKLDYDLDDDGIPNAIEAVADDGTTLYPDTDGDNIPDYLDPDTDNDSIPDADEGNGDPDHDGIPNYQDNDSDGDGIPDNTEGTGDVDSDGIPNYLDNNNNDGPNGDADGDTILNKDEDIPGHTDADDDGILNKADPDSDNDGISDREEAGDGNPNTPPIDTDGDGLPDFIEPKAEAEHSSAHLIFLPAIFKK